MPKKTASVVAERKKESTQPKSDLVRVEESVDSFIKAQLPHITGTRIGVTFLWSKKGRSYYRCRYYQYGQDGSCGSVSRKEVDSRFVVVETVDANKVLTDLTGKRK